MVVRYAFLSLSFSFILRLVCLTQHFSQLFTKGGTRVYLIAELQISRALPTFIVDYAADRAMPRATTWLKPQVEAAAALWLKYPAA